MKILKKILKTQRVHEFVEINKHPVITGNCIYAVNHSCKKRKFVENEVKNVGVTLDAIKSLLVRYKQFLGIN